MTSTQSHSIVTASLRALLALTLVATLLAAPARADDPPPADSTTTDAPAADVAPAPVTDAAVTTDAPAGLTSTVSVGPNSRLTAVRKVRLTERSHNVMRSGPGDAYSIVGLFAKGTEFVVVTKSGDWFGVRLSTTETGWIHSSLCKEFDDLSDLEWRPNPKLYSRTGSFVLNGYAGAYAFDRKSNSLVLGGRLGYYIFDRLQFEGGVSWTHISRPAEIVESLFDLSLEAEKFHMLFYNLNFTLELLPGRQMVPFVTGGVGSNIMQGDTETAYNMGAGTMLFLSKRTAMRWEVRDYRFKSGAENARVSNDNVEFSLGTFYLF
ncbi:MAG: SH3 domain-containing protein [Candidatus Eisenbacteria bacterium]|uniref:SH3 domain-containing protein n=1 Tax=Eiseniibacteriota bacterium TaxID=2212470 RepID=A0A849SHA1_UNCEI|nr:SH3 domain-containing protein [Candidatus Eisenbacteria bacterium]